MPNTTAAHCIISWALLMKKIISCPQKLVFLLQCLKNIFRYWIWGPKSTCISFGQQAFVLKDVPSFYNRKGGKAMWNRQRSSQNVLHMDRTSNPWCTLWAGGVFQHVKSLTISELLLDFNFDPKAGLFSVPPQLLHPTSIYIKASVSLELVWRQF